MKTKKSEQQILNPIVANTFEEISKRKGIKKSCISKVERFKIINQNIKFPSSTLYKINMDWTEGGYSLNNLSKPIPKSIYY